MTTTPRRILAIDPGTRYMGVAVLQGTELIYYAVKTFTAKRPADELIRGTRAVLLDLIQQYHPDVLAHEKTFYVQSKNSALLQVQEAEIKQTGRMAGLRVVGYSPAHVRKLLVEDGRATKEAVADVLASRFPVLNPYRFDPGTLRARYWLNMFDALAVAVVATQEMDRGSNSFVEESRSAA